MKVLDYRKTQIQVCLQQEISLDDSGTDYSFSTSQGCCGGKLQKVLGKKGGIFI